MAVTIVVQTTQAGGSVQKLRAKQQIEWYAGETLAGKAFYDESLTKDELVIERRVEPYERNKSVMKVSFFVYNNNGTIIDKQHYLFYDTN